MKEGKGKVWKKVKIKKAKWRENKRSTERKGKKKYERKKKIYKQKQ